MDSKKKQKDALLKIIAQLEIEIAVWPSRNSQSNPGAVMELRSMKKDLLQAQAALKALIHDKADE
jgi:hypothetical protein